jgi:pyruvate ferredoxin oxidoreductase gamma subunit
MVVILDETLLDAVDVTEGLVGEKIVIVNTTTNPGEIRKKIGLEGGGVFCVDATGISIEKIGRNFPNTPMLGALVKASGLIKLESLIESFKHEFGKKFSDKVMQGNIEAMQKAYDEVKAE